MQLELSDEERKSNEERHALSRDGDGNEVFVGLSWTQSLELLGHIRMNSLAIRAAGIRQDRDVKKRGIELRQKHETARLKAQWTAQGED